ncbi:MAG: PEP-CTERM sorting domain-containing protein [Opitutaceae bacterium]
MKKLNLIIVGTLALAVGAQAQIYTQDFSAAITTVDAGAGSAYFGTDGTPASNFAVGDFVGANGDLGLAVVSEALNATGITNGSQRSRGFGVLIDTSGAAAGDYTVSFDVSNYLNPNAVDGDSITLNVFEFENTGTGLVSYIDADQAFNTTDTDGKIFSKFDADDTFSAGNRGVLGAGTITGDGLFELDITITMAGDTGDYLFLNWQLMSTEFETVSTAGPSFTMDNIAVTSVPEPSTYALLSGLLALSFVMVRRRK